MYKKTHQPFAKALKKPIKNAIIASIALCGLCLSSTTIAEQNATVSAERWFEIEVILLEQLTNKSRSNEDFNHQQHLRSKTQNIELLSSYLQNISNYGQQLKDCEPMDNKFASQNSLTDQVLSSQVMAQQKAKLQQHAINAAVFSQRVEDQQVNNINTTTSISNQLKTLQITCKQEHYSEFENVIEHELYQIPKQISQQEDLYTNVPYLLNRNSLKLGHIYKSLRSSAQFRPVLHLGWRQAVLDRRHAKPVRLMAGDNQLLANEQQPVVEPHQDTVINAEQQQTFINQHIQQIINDINLQNIDVVALQKQVAGDELIPKAESKSVSDSLASNQKKQKQQTWKIDGLFNVHLDHYLFINSQFNIVNTEFNSTSHETNIVDQQQIMIPFKQNRRVISGEIHYFDHPYIGMIVQIRRHQRPDSLDTLDSQP